MYYVHMHIVVAALHGGCNYYVGSIAIACTSGMYVTHTETALLLSTVQHTYMHTLCNIHVLYILCCGAMLQINVGGSAFLTVIYR